MLDIRPHYLVAPAYLQRLQLCSGSYGVSRCFTKTHAATADTTLAETVIKIDIENVITEPTEVREPDMMACELRNVLRSN